MIFLRYESLREYIKFYPMIATILCINIVLYLVTLSTSGKMQLFEFGALISHPHYVFDWWRYVTSVFLHHGFGHLLFNGFSLFLFGPYLERLLGKVKFIILYLGSGIAGNVLSIIISSKMMSPSISVGASGAIYGLLGAYIFISFYRRRYIDGQSRQMVIVILVIGVIYSLMNPAINLNAHIGGFIGGFLIIPLFLKH